MFSRFDRIPACDGRMDGQTSCHGIARAICIRVARGKNVIIHWIEIGRIPNSPDHLSLVMKSLQFDFSHSCLVRDV